jgi:hypothetical protein
MTPTKHKIYIGTLVTIVIVTFVYIISNGYTYYQLNIEERFFHPLHESLKPSGSWGHGLGIIGTLLIIVGVSIYMIRKRNRRFSQLGTMKYWLEFHIFLCTLGPILVLFHTAFKFGGIISISFWSMVAVVLSGVIGRYIYLQIPRTIEGREMNRLELDQKKTEIKLLLTNTYHIDNDVLKTVFEAISKRPDRTGGNPLTRFVSKFKFEMSVRHEIKKLLQSQKLSKENHGHVMKLINSEITLARKIDRLVTMQNLFKYWHVAHLPFAIIMLVIMIVHVAVTLMFGYRWIF